MLRLRAKSQAIVVPATKVNGTRTAFGQWTAAKIAPAIIAAGQGREQSSSR